MIRRHLLPALLTRTVLVLSFVLFFAAATPQTSARYDPLSRPNNRYGIHIADTNDIAEAASLVNANGGDWGYVTFVIPDTDRDEGKWQNIFNQLRKLRVIPILRIASHTEGPVWARPKPEHINDWVAFLTKLNWPTENRYVVIYNEPNHANEWGGNVDPEHYAETFTAFASALHGASEDFFVLPAGLDASAPNSQATMDEAAFLKRVIQAKPQFLEYLDGWASHSYPNPAFSGSPFGSGKGSVRTFEWELDMLSVLGLQKKLPVFITETGWMHSQGRIIENELLSPSQVADNMAVTARNVWADPRVVAVTPFLLNYQDIPFDHFSWRMLGSSDYYEPYQTYRALPKTNGKPKIREAYSVANTLLPATLVADSTYTFQAELKNSGQGIFDEKHGYGLSVREESKMFLSLFESLPRLEPNESGPLTLHLKTPKNPGRYALDVVLIHDDTSITLERQDVLVIPPPSVTLFFQLGWRTTGDVSDVSVLIYDKNQKLLHKATGLTGTRGRLTVPNLYDIVPGDTYRIVTLIPYYLPRQVVTPLSGRNSEIPVKRFYPLDFNKDGAFTFTDLGTLLTLHPHLVIGRFFGP